MRVMDSTHLRPVLGVALKLTSVVLLGTMAACVKQLGQSVPSGQIIFVRGAISIALLAVLAWQVEGLHLLKARNWRSHALRSLCGTVSMFCLFTALALLPFADVTGITFSAPMFLTLLAMLFLGERIHAYRWSALGIGFLGVLIIVGPHLRFESGSSIGALVALAAAIFSALAMIFLRSMSAGGREHAITITFYFSLTSMVFAGLTAFAGWPMPTATEWRLLLAAGVLGVLGQLVMTYSYRYAEASTIAPLDYANLIVAVLYGYFFFDETPGLSTWIGASLVVAAGLVILWREYRLSTRAAASAGGLASLPPGG